MKESKTKIMKKKKIIKKLIKLYKGAITQCEQMDSVQHIKNYLQTCNLKDGVCYAAMFCYNVDIYNKKWIERNKEKDNDYWLSTPAEQGTKSGILKVLNTRLKILKKELNKTKS